MLKKVFLSILSLFLLGSLSVMATEKKIVSENESGFQYTAEENYNADLYSHYINDEQKQDMIEKDDIKVPMTFMQQVINSGHFTSNTSTKTYIPLRKIQ